MTIASRRSIWARFVLVSRPFFRSEIRGRALLMLGLLVALLLSVSGLNVVNSYVGRDFMTAIAERQPERFRLLALLYAGVFVFSTLVAVFYRFTEERLGLLWRRWLTEHLLERYLSGRMSLRLEARPDIDNPDQRMTEDVRTFTATTLSFLLILVNATVTLFAFCGVLWSISPLLLLAAAGYAALGSVVALVLGRPLVDLNIQQLKREADLRYELIRAREQPEGGDPEAEKGPARDRLLGVVENLKRIIAVNRNLGFFTTGYNYLTQLIPVLIVAPLYIRGEIAFGMVTQAAMAFAHVLGAFSLIVVEFQRISSFAAVIARLGSLCEALELAPRPVVPEGGSGVTPVVTAPGGFRR